MNLRGGTAWPFRGGSCPIPEASLGTGGGGCSIPTEPQRGGSGQGDAITCGFGHAQSHVSISPWLGACSLSQKPFRVKLLLCVGPVCSPRAPLGGTAPTMGCRMGGSPAPVPLHRCLRAGDDGRRHGQAVRRAPGRGGRDPAGQWGGRLGAGAGPYP